MKKQSQIGQINMSEDNPYWISFSDLMSALLVVFILAAVALMIELTQTQEEVAKDIEQLQNAEQARKDILTEVRDELRTQDIVVEIADNDSVLRIPQSTLTFASDSYELSTDESARSAVKAIGMALHAALNRPFDPSKNNLMRFDYLDTIFIEGHTDSLRTQRVKGNWGLSAFRAISLWDFWTQDLQVTPDFDAMTSATGQKLFSVSGYAQTRRIQLDEVTPEQRQQNRRIDLRFTVKRPSIAELKAVTAFGN